MHHIIFRILAEVRHTLQERSLQRMRIMFHHLPCPYFHIHTRTQSVRQSHKIAAHADNHHPDSSQPSRNPDTRSKQPAHYRTNQQPHKSHHNSNHLLSHLHKIFFLNTDYLPFKRRLIQRLKLLRFTLRQRFQPSRVFFLPLFPAPIRTRSIRCSGHIRRSASRNFHQ